MAILEEGGRDCAHTLTGIPTVVDSTAYGEVQLSACVTSGRECVFISVDSLCAPSVSSVSVSSRRVGIVTLSILGNDSAPHVISPTVLKDERIAHPSQGVDQQSIIRKH